MIQLQVLNYILDTKDSSLISLNNLDSSYFPQYKNEFNFIQKHLENYGYICDKETFLSQFTDFKVLEVKEKPEYLIKSLFDNYNTQTLAETFNQVRTLLMSGKTAEAMELSSKAQEKLKTGVALQSVDIFKDLSRYDEFLDKVQNKDEYFITTGFKELDAITGGFSRKDELAVIAAKTNEGKSWVLLKCAVAAAQQGLTVGIYSGEMSVSEEAYRIDTLLGHISNFAISKGNGAYEVKYKQYLDSLPTIMKGTIKIVTDNNFNGATTVNCLKSFIEKDKLDILFVDQLTLLEDQRKSRERTQSLENIMKDMKKLQTSKQIPIINVTQLNRTKNEDGSTDNTQMGGAYRITQDATMILLLSRDKDILKAHLSKSRGSKRDIVLSYAADFDKGIFTYIPNENDEEQIKELEDRYAIKSTTQSDEVF